MIAPVRIQEPAGRAAHAIVVMCVIDTTDMSYYDDNPWRPDMPRGRPYSHQDDLAIIEAFTPRAERIEAVARDLGRTPAAVTKRYYRLLAEHTSPDSNITGPRDYQRSMP